MQSPPEVCFTCATAGELIRISRHHVPIDLFVGTHNRVLDNLNSLARHAPTGKCPRIHDTSPFCSHHRCPSNHPDDTPFTISHSQPLGNPYLSPHPRQSRNCSSRRGPCPWGTTSTSRLACLRHFDPKVGFSTPVRFYMAPLRTPCQESCALNSTATISRGQVLLLNCSESPGEYPISTPTSVIAKARNWHTHSPWYRVHACNRISAAC